VKVGRLVSGIKNTHPANKEWTAPLGGFFDSSTWCAHHSQLVLCCKFAAFADGYRSRVDTTVLPDTWLLDYVCEKEHFGRVIEIEAIRAHKQGKPFQIARLAATDLATVNPRGPACEEEKALYIAAVQEQVLRELNYALAKRQKHALAKKWTCETILLDLLVV
jgi:hypothetical protein